MNLELAGGKIFSDAWHRVASVQVQLRSSVGAHRQYFRGEPWVILRDRFSNDWFRISPDAYAFLCRLESGCSVDEAWNESLAADPKRALTQEEVVQLLGQLNLSNLLQYDRSDSAATLFERMSRRKKSETVALLMGFLSIKIPLYDPDHLLEKAMPLIRRIYGPVGMVLYLLLLLAGGKALMEESSRLFDQGSGLLAPSNLGLLYIGFLISKLLHEFSHAAVCKRFGGEVHRMGVMLLIFAPMPYVDATSAWGFKQRSKRILVSLAGVVAELAFAAAAALVWANTAPGTLNALAYNVIFVASVSTLLFNMNPLMRFDGYHILVDALEVPNLFQRSREQLRYLGERFLLQLPHAQPAARTATESWLLPAFGLLSMLYWLLLMFNIMLFIAGEYFELGVALAILLFFMSLVVPLFKFVKYLASSPNLDHHRSHAVGISLVLSMVAIMVLGLLPVPDRIRVMGVVQAGQSRQLHVESEGFFSELLARPGTVVQRGQPLLRLSNPDLEMEIRAAKMQLKQLKAQEIQAIAGAVAELSAIYRQKQAAEESLSTLLGRKEGLLVVAPVAGIWSASELDASHGQWLGRGASAGTIVNQEDWRFVAVLPQVASHAFEDTIQQTEVRLRGQEEINLLAQATVVMPFEQGQLPSRALGMAGGGDIAVSNADSSGLTAAESFFRIESILSVDALTHARLLHGHVGTMRLTLSDRPLFAQWERKLRQLFQRRFRV
ncbi:hypothetical protein [Candidatus Magnetaquicoccus inordinatus]|uniref:hypothetical protein n=1 Tax=Candidatus Magnetaquicoccus inordinatus TaxID=2496818 RepID=UPI00102B9D92|nr:hypothetical protein [Candidatus Magnetaquicoccus inordinatus]